MPVRAAASQVELAFNDSGYILHHPTLVLPLMTPTGFRVLRRPVRIDTSAYFRDARHSAGDSAI